MRFPADRSATLEKQGIGNTYAPSGNSSSSGNATKTPPMSTDISRHYLKNPPAPMTGPGGRFSGSTGPAGHNN